MFCIHKIKTRLYYYPSINRTWSTNHINKMKTGDCEVRIMIDKNEDLKTMDQIMWRFDWVMLT